MAIRWAVASGNWSDANTWNDGGTLGVPGDGDEARLNGKTVTMDAARLPAQGSLAVLSGLASDGVTPASGQLAVPTATLGNCQIHAGQILASAAAIIMISGSGDSHVALSIYGNVAGGTAANARGVNNPTPSSVAITGDVCGGSAATAYGVYSAGGGGLSIAGNVYGGLLAHGVYLYGTPALASIVGNVQGGSGTGVYGVCNATNATVTITGDVAGGTGSIAYGAFNGTGALTITGNLIYSSRSPFVCGPFNYVPNDCNYIQVGIAKFPPQLPAEKILHGTVHGDITGTLAASTIGTVTGTTNLTPDALKKDVQVDDVLGTLAASAATGGGRLGLGL